MTTKRRVSGLTDRLATLDRGGPIRYRGVSSDGTIAVTVDGRERVYTEPAMDNWLAGFTAGDGAARQPDVAAQRTRPLRFLRRVLVNPDPEDQHRIDILRLMEEAGVGVGELADRSDLDRKHLSGDLRFLHPGTFSLRTHLGVHDPVVSKARAATDPNAPTSLVPPARALEPSRMRDLRVLAVLHESGLIDWFGPKHRISAPGLGGMMILDPTRLLASTSFQVRVGEQGQAYTVAAAHTQPWAVGLCDRMDPDLAESIYQLPRTP